MCQADPPPPNQFHVQDEYIAGGKSNFALKFWVGELRGGRGEEGSKILRLEEYVLWNTNVKLIKHYTQNRARGQELHKEVHS